MPGLPIGCVSHTSDGNQRATNLARSWGEQAPPSLTRLCCLQGFRCVDFDLFRSGLSAPGQLENKHPVHIILIRTGEP